jgi:hypothetical protein
MSLTYIDFCLSLPGYELSSDEEELPLPHDDPADGGSALDDLQPHNGQPILQQPPALPSFDFLAILRRSGGNTCELLHSIREADTYLPPGPIHVYSERAGGAVRLHIVHIVYFLHIVTNKHFYYRREVLKHRASNFSRSVCEVFAFATSETVSIESGNRILQAVGNVRSLYI